MYGTNIDCPTHVSVIFPIYRHLTSPLACRRKTRPSDPLNLVQNNRKALDKVKQELQQDVEQEFQKLDRWVSSLLCHRRNRVTWYKTTGRRWTKSNRNFNKTWNRSFRNSTGGCQVCLSPTAVHVHVLQYVD